MVSKYQIPGWFRSTPWVLFWQQRALQERAEVAMVNPVTAKPITIRMIWKVTEKRVFFNYTVCLNIILLKNLNSG